MGRRQFLRSSAASGVAAAVGVGAGSAAELFVPAPRADTTHRATDLASYRAKYRL